MSFHHHFKHPKLIYSSYFTCFYNYQFIIIIIIATIAAITTVIAMAMALLHFPLLK